MFLFENTNCSRISGKRNTSKRVDNSNRLNVHKHLQHWFPRPQKQADGGEEGLKLARERKPDVIVLDLQMPTVDGFTVLQQLAADERTNAIPVVVSTSMTIDDALRSRLPDHVRLISKNAISRESVSSFLRDAVQSN